MRRTETYGLVVCAWCQCEMGVKAGLPEGVVTHGICQPCKAEARARIMQAPQVGSAGTHGQEGL